MAAAVAMVALTCGAPAVFGQNGEPPLPDSDAPLAEPIVEADSMLGAQKATAWRDSERVRYLLLENDVRFIVGRYGFRADRALVRIVIEQRPGQSVYHFAAYLDNARTLRGHGPVTAEGGRLLVTAAARGDVTMETDLLQRADSAPDVALVNDGIARIKRRDARLAQRVISPPDEPLYDESVWQRRAARRREIQMPTPTRGQRTQPADETGDQPDETAPTDQPDQTQPADQPQDQPQDQDQTQPATAPTEPAQPTGPPPGAGVLPTTGTMRFNADRIVYNRGEQHLMLIGDVRLYYEDRENDRQVTLKTERAVLFLSEAANAADGEAGPTEGIDAQNIRGVYLEDNAVITDGRFTVRAPRIYYDIQLNQAMLLEAVMYTYDIQQNVPLYVRADVMRQTSRTSFEARRALLTTTAFAEPHFAIGASQVTLEQTETPTGQTEQWFTAKHTTFEVSGVPVFYWPYVAAETQDIPITGVSVGHSSDNGMEVQTQWDLFALLGREAPEDVDAALDIDYRGDHGPATGIQLDYEPEGMVGELDSYFLPMDNGIDEISNRRDVEQMNETRGFVHWQHRQALANDWDLLLEAAYVSDVTFLDEFRTEEAYEARPYETSFYLTKQQEDWQLDLLAKTNLNDFTPQLTQLQTPGYDVEKAPELGYYRTGTNLWDNRLTWYSENRLSRVRAQFGEETPADRGFRQRHAIALFGFGEDTSFADNADAMNFPTDWRTRFDSRQEITAPMKAGEVNITPYVAGRFTGYDDDFEQFNSSSKQVRLWGSAGTRFHTQFHRTYNADSELLNVQGLRHIIEPNADVFYAASTLDSEDLPIYDPQVEGITEGAGVRLGMTNTLQTQRGGPGRWRSVDWLTLQTDVILRSDDAPTEQEIGRFYSYRPEYSLGGDHFYTRMLWMVSDTLGVTGEMTHNLEDGRVAQWRVGASLDHTPRLKSYLEYNEIDILNSRLLSYGFTYELTTKYTFGFSQTLDFGEDESRDLKLSLARRLPSWDLEVFAKFDELENEQTVGIILTPNILGSASPSFKSDLFDTGKR